MYALNISYLFGEEDKPSQVGNCHLNLGWKTLEQAEDTRRRIQSHETQYHRLHDYNFYPGAVINRTEAMSEYLASDWAYLKKTRRAKIPVVKLELPRAIVLAAGDGSSRVIFEPPWVGADASLETVEIIEVPDDSPYAYPD